MVALMVEVEMYFESSMRIPSKKWAWQSQQTKKMDFNELYFLPFFRFKREKEVGEIGNGLANPLEDAEKEVFSVAQGGTSRERRK